MTTAAIYLAEFAAAYAALKMAYWAASLAEPARRTSVRFKRLPAAPALLF